MVMGSLRSYSCSLEHSCTHTAVGRMHLACTGNAQVCARTVLVQYVLAPFASALSSSCSSYPLRVRRTRLFHSISVRHIVRRGSSVEARAAGRRKYVYISIFIFQFSFFNFQF